MYGLTRLEDAAGHPVWNFGSCIYHWACTPWCKKTYFQTGSSETYFILFPPGPACVNRIVSVGGLSPLVQASSMQIHLPMLWIKYKTTSCLNLTHRQPNTGNQTQAPLYIYVSRFSINNLLLVNLMSSKGFVHNLFAVFPTRVLYLVTHHERMKIHNYQQKAYIKCLLKLHWYFLCYAFSKFCSNMAAPLAGAGFYNLPFR